MVRSREEAAKQARQSKTNVPGTCQLWTRTQYLAPSAGDQDRDGDADAVDGWKSEPRWAKHSGDRKPPLGTPVAWSGGRSGFGHRAISLGPDKNGVYHIRSTDAGGSGVVATVPLDWPERNWGLHYLGWSETITGLKIPSDKKPVVPPKPPTRGVRVDTMLDKGKEAAKIAKDGSERDRLIKRAMRSLRQIKFLKPKKKK